MKRLAFSHMPSFFLSFFLPLSLPFSTLSLSVAFHLG